MIFYFSGTGNSRWAALQIAAQTGDQAVDLIGQKHIPDLGQQEQIGLVFPVYAWGAPEPVRTFAKNCRKPAHLPSVLQPVGKKPV